MNTAQSIIGRGASTPEEADTDAEFEVRQWTIDEQDHDQRLDKVLVRHAPEFSRTHLQALIERGCVTLGGLIVRQAAARPRLGQPIRIELHPTEQAQAFKPQAMDLVIVHEDEHLLVIDKPVGLVVHPAPGHWSGTLLNGLLARDAAAARLPRAGIVHRLDKDTSGLMLVARSQPAALALVQAIAERRVQRHYLALAHGHLNAAEQTVDAPIGRDPRTRVKMAVVSGGRPSQTTVRVLAPSPTTVSAVTAVECRLHTGRTHQIRVHLAHLGHPLVGDTLYGGRVWQGLERQALHAWRLSLAHPVSGHPMTFVSPIPPDMAPAWAAAGGATMED